MRFKVSDIIKIQKLSFAYNHGMKRAMRESDKLIEDMTPNINVLERLKIYRILEIADYNIGRKCKALEDLGYEIEHDEHIPQTVYISGRIQDNPNAEVEFQSAEDKITARGDYIINPQKLIKVMPNAAYEDYMAVCGCLLRQCNVDIIYLLKGWENSKGAKIERKIAEEMEIKIEYEEKVEI